MHRDLIFGHMMQNSAPFLMIWIKMWRSNFLDRSPGGHGLISDLKLEGLLSSTIPNGTIHVRPFNTQMPNHLSYDVLSHFNWDLI